MNESEPSSAIALALAAAKKEGVWLKAFGFYLVHQASGKSYSTLIADELLTPGNSDETNKGVTLKVKEIFEKFGLI